MNKIIIVLLLFILSSSIHARSGGSVGNGGDSIHCLAGDRFPFTGLFVLDYVLEYKEGQLADIKNVSESLSRINKNLSRFSPSLSKQFKEYVSSIFNTDQTKLRVWKASDLKERDIKDENILRRLPVNCDPTKLQQTVIRTYNSRNIIYNYQENIFNKYKLSQPIQLSFILVHEWLWDYTTNVRALRKLNWLLHSNRSDKINAEYFNGLTQRYDFFDRTLSPCDRSDFVQKNYSAACKGKTIAELITTKSLSFKDDKISKHVRPGDFRGLFKLTKLDLSNQHNILSLLPPYSFRDLKNLKYLNLANTKTIKLPFWFTSDMKLIEVLDLRNNPIHSIPNMLKSFPDFRTLHVTRNEKLNESTINTQHYPFDIIFY